MRTVDSHPDQHEDPLLVDVRLGSLTTREREVLCLLGRGLTNREIAEVLVVEESTAKCHVGRVLTKTGSRNRVEAVIMAIHAGLVRAPG